MFVNRNAIDNHHNTISGLSIDFEIFLHLKYHGSIRFEFFSKIILFYVNKINLMKNYYFCQIFEKIKGYSFGDQ